MITIATICKITIAKQTTKVYQANHCKNKTSVEIMTIGMFCVSVLTAIEGIKPQQYPSAAEVYKVATI